MIIQEFGQRGEVQAALFTLTSGSSSGGRNLHGLPCLRHERPPPGERPTTTEVAKVEVDPLDEFMSTMDAELTKDPELKGGRGLRKTWKTG